MNVLGDLSELLVSILIITTEILLIKSDFECRFIWAFEISHMKSRYFVPHVYISCMMSAIHAGC